MLSKISEHTCLVVTIVAYIHNMVSAITFYDDLITLHRRTTTAYSMLEDELWPLLNMVTVDQDIDRLEQQ